MPSSFFILKNPLQAHPADLTLTIKGNSFRREELAKIKLINIKKVSKPHLQLEIRKLQMSLNKLTDLHTGYIRINHKNLS
jgi:hypothetical protein